MELSSLFCRTQEIYQRDRAINATLENVRAVAGRAADAWRLEALDAERREARYDRTHVIAEMAAVLKRNRRQKIPAPES